MIEEESEIVRNCWRKVKAIAGDGLPALLCGNPMLAEWSARSLIEFATYRIGYNADAGTEYLNGNCLNFRLCNGHYLVQS